MPSIMSSISDHAIIQFSEMVHVRTQQKKARLLPFVEQKKMTGKIMAYDGMGTVELSQITGRFAEVVFSDFEFNRRKITRKKFGATIPLDGTDIEELLTSPESRLIEALAMAAARQSDRIIVDAMFADVQTGEDMDTTVTYANDGGTTVVATTALTYEKLLEIRKNFINNEVGNDGLTKLAMGITGDEYEDMMTEIELTSGDYSKQFVVDQGEIAKAVGINMVMFASSGAGGANPILPVTTGTRTSFCMAEGAICLATSRAWSFKVLDRPDLYDTKQLQVTGVMGAVRTEGKLIQKVTLTAG